MEKKHKEHVLISSVNEIRPSLRIKSKQTAHFVGFFVSIAVVLGFVAFDFFPKQNDRFFQYIDLLLMISTPLAAYIVGYLFGLNIALWSKGFVLTEGYPGGNNSSLSQINQSNGSSSAYRGYSFGSSVSINPSSGRPMSGSSGIDTHGNPYGTRSW